MDYIGKVGQQADLRKLIHNCRDTGLHKTQMRPQKYRMIASEHVQSLFAVPGFLSRTDVHIPIQHAMTFTPSAN